MSDLDAKLWPYMDAIENAARSGDTRAKRIVSLYGQHRTGTGAFDAANQCSAAFDDWVRRGE